MNSDGAVIHCFETRKQRHVIYCEKRDEIAFNRRSEAISLCAMQGNSIRCDWPLARPGAGLGVQVDQNGTLSSPPCLGGDAESVLYQLCCIKSFEPTDARRDRIALRLEAIQSIAPDRPEIAVGKESRLGPAKWFVAFRFNPNQKVRRLDHRIEPGMQPAAPGKPQALFEAKAGRLGNG